MIKYALFNDVTGLYEYFASIEEAIDVLVQKKSELMLLLNPISVVESFDDGSEVWKNVDGVVIDNLSETAQISQFIHKKYDWVE